MAYQLDLDYLHHGIYGQETYETADLKKVLWLLENSIGGGFINVYILIELGEPWSELID